MSCHLHDLLEEVEDMSYRLAPYFAASPNRRLFQEVNQAMGNAKNAMCFDMGPAENLAHHQIIPELVKLPYDTCWFESRLTRSPGYSDIGILANGGGREFVLWSKSKADSFWVFMCCAEVEYGSDAIRFVISKDADAAPERGALSTFMEFVFAFLSALNCSNVTRVESLPPLKLQKARAKRGKKPLFSYWTLEIHLPKRAKENTTAGETHAAKRLHLCRGHMKKRKTGYFWWQPHVRGDKKLGMVHKEYVLRQPAAVS